MPNRVLPASMEARASYGEEISDQDSCETLKSGIQPRLSPLTKRSARYTCGSPVHYWAKDKTGRIHFGWLRGVYVSDKSSEGIDAAPTAYGGFFENDKLIQVYEFNRTDTDTVPPYGTMD